MTMETITTCITNAITCVGSALVVRLSVRPLQFSHE